MQQDLAGKNFVITGTTSGIGEVTALELARRGAHLLMCNRSLEKSQPVLQRIATECGPDRAQFIKLDLTSMESVRECGRQVLATGLPLHGLINNAGFAGTRGLTTEGFELAFGVNHLGHFVLTNLLLEQLKKSGPSRIVNVASTAHYDAKGIDWEAQRKPTATVTGVAEYAVSKLCNVMFTQELARRLQGTQVTTFSLHPGVVASDAWRKVPWPIRPIIKLFMISPEQGARTTLYCATSPDVATLSGRYFDNCKEKEPNRVTQDGTLAAELWKRSEDWSRAWLAPL